MTLNDIQKQKVFEFIKDEYEKEIERFSRKCDEHIENGDLEQWIVSESENEAMDIDSKVLEIQSQLNISNHDSEIKMIFKKYLFENILEARIFL